MGIHESQSRFYENIIGRSEAFISLIFPKIKELFPEQFENVSAHDFYLAVNKAEPSLIRTEADELTYSMHIMVRYEIEKRLMDGSLSTKDLPNEWNRCMKGISRNRCSLRQHGLPSGFSLERRRAGLFPELFPRLCLRCAIPSQNETGY